MGIFDFLKRDPNKNIKNSNGYNRITFPEGNKEVYFEKNGKKDGIYKSYYKNGNLKEEIDYKNGVKNGVSREYYESGELEQEFNFINGLCSGPCKMFYKNGQLNFQSNYNNNGKLEGKTKHYFKNGLLHEERFYQNNKSKKVKKYFLDGSIISSKIETSTKFIDGESRIFIENKLEGVEQKSENLSKTKEDLKTSIQSQPKDTEDIRYNRTVDLDIDMDSIYRKMDEIKDPRRKNDEGYLRWKKKEDLIKS